MMTISPVACSAYLTGYNRGDRFGGSTPYGMMTLSCTSPVAPAIGVKCETIVAPHICVANVRPFCACLKRAQLCFRSIPMFWQQTRSQKWKTPPDGGASKEGLR